MFFLTLTKTLVGSTGSEIFLGETMTLNDLPDNFSETSMCKVCFKSFCCNFASIVKTHLIGDIQDENNKLVSFGE